MKKTLESFIDPANIPKKYGGQLEFEFGDMPKLDPHLKSVLEWQNGNTDFPHGPMYWVNDKGHKETGKVEGTKIKALAVGSEGKKERNEEVCVVTTTYTEAMNGHAIKEPESEKVNQIPASRPDFLTVPGGIENVDTEPSSPVAPSMATTEAESELEEEKLLLPEGETPVIQDGEVVPASRPEPVSFVTATEGVKTLSLDAKSGNVPNGSIVKNGEVKVPHLTDTAHLLDPNLNLGEGELKTEDASKHVAEPEKAVGAGGEGADKAHA